MFEETGRNRSVRTPRSFMVQRRGTGDLSSECVLCEFVGMFTYLCSGPLFRVIYKLLVQVIDFGTLSSHSTSGAVGEAERPWPWL